MKLNDLLEAASTNPMLYHATNLESIIAILKGNILRADTEHLISDINPERRHEFRSKDDYSERDDTISGVSLTRDKMFAENWSDVILVIDWNKLKQNYKIKQVSYYGDDGSNNREESEEFVIGPIKNLDRYIAGIYFPARLEKQYTDWQWVQKNIAHVDAEFAGWKVVVESPKYVGKPINNIQQQKKVGESLSESIVWHKGNYTIKTKNFDQDSVALDLFDQEKRIGYIVAELNDGYADIKAAMINHDFKGKGFGKLLYQQLLSVLKPEIKGIRSEISNRLNNKEIPSIYKSMGGYEKDGYAFVDKLSTNEDIAYHGSDVDFDVFDIKYVGKKTDDGIWGSGFYFTNHKATAQAYGKNLYKVDLNIRNPLDLTKFKTTEELAEYLDVSETILSKRNRAIGCRLPYSRTFSSAVKEKGHDSVLVQDGEHKEIVVFDSKLISMHKKEPVTEYGRIVAGVNTPKGITPEHTKKMAKRFGNNVNKAGYAPIMPTNGKINTTPPEDKDYSELDRQSFFKTRLDLNTNTDGKTKDIAESTGTPTVQVKSGKLYDYDFNLILNKKNVGQASIEKTTWNDKSAIEVGSIYIDKEFRKQGFGKKLLSAIKSKFQSSNDYVIAEIVSMTSFGAFKQIFGSPIYISSIVDDVAEKELSNYLPVTAKEDDDGTIDGSSRLYFVFKLKQNIKESWQRISGDKTNFQPANKDIDIQYGVTDFSKGQTDGYVAAYDTAQPKKYRDPIHGEANHMCVGLLNWSEYEGKVLIKMVQVIPEYQKQRIALCLLSRLQKEFPKVEIDFGYVTGEGKALMESKSAPLYHAATLMNAGNIILSNTLMPNTNQNITGLPGSKQNKNTKAVAGVSLTRSLQFAKTFDNISDDHRIIFVLDQEKLNQKYKIRPVDFFTTNPAADDMRPYALRRKGPYAESEEFVIGPINGLDKYITKIIITKAAEMFAQQIIKKDPEGKKPHSKEFQDLYNVVKSNPKTVIEK